MNLTFNFITDEAQWSAALSTFQNVDFHHTYAFHKISLDNGEGEPLLLVANDGDTLIMVWSLLSRVIPGTTHKDLGTVYGYPGPLSIGRHPLIDVLREAFVWLAEKGYVSVVGRLHPIANVDLLGGQDYPEVRKLGTVVAVDLKRDIAELKREIRGAKNGTIKKIEKSGVTIRQSRSPVDTPVFQSIYSETMDRIGADSYYYFKNEYLNSLLSADCFDACYQFAELEGEVIAAASIIDTKEVRQYYLSGTSSEHSRLSPMSLVLRDQIFDAKEQGLSWFILGGGLGGQVDSLTHYKLGFSKTTFTAGLICKNLRPELYSELSGSRDIDFFPAYRAP